MNDGLKAMPMTVDYMSIFSSQKRIDGMAVSLQGPEAVTRLARLHTRIAMNGIGSIVQDLLADIWL